MVLGAKVGSGVACFVEHFADIVVDFDSLVFHYKSAEADSGFGAVAEE